MMYCGYIIITGLCLWNPKMYLYSISIHTAVIWNICKSYVNFLTVAFGKFNASLFNKSIIIFFLYKNILQTPNWLLNDCSL